ncbi:AAA family ATPase [Peribacillus simplex]|uniref:AAA family ATPase n=1 Tax=Peribacillus simplex TaxID=1478 RepID=UPI0019216898|nr:AAA family ATPase [Peribacillus simplex]MBD8590407.1 AAA family ATPase [Peribacillus simplex]
MIFIKRGSAPNFLNSRDIKNEKEKMSLYYNKPLEKRETSRYKDVNFPEILDKIEGEFNLKCAYCETFIDEGKGCVERYRPNGGTYINEDYYPDHYWWLAYDWKNLYHACHTCSKNKGRKFPIQGKPAAFSTQDNELHDELPVLLDPCFDNPEEYLFFDETGQVHSDRERGYVTIALLDLNREQLVKQREETLSSFKKFLNKASENVNILLHVIEEIGGYDGVITEYIAMKKQHLKIWLNRNPKFGVNEEYKMVVKEIEKLLESTPLITYQLRRIKIQAQENLEKKIEEYDLEGHDKLLNYYIKKRFIRKVEISNFKSISHLVLDLRTEDSGGKWLMLLGENGTGKSSILQAIALCLMGNDHRKRFNASNYLKDTTKNGFIRIYLTGSRKPLELHFNKNSNNFISNQGSQQVIVLGYGATRLMPDSFHKSPPISVCRIENLFNPYSPLVDVNEYLYNLSNEEFHYVRSAIESLLVLDDSDTICRGEKLNQILVTINKTTVELGDLSAGYQSMIALATDIMITMKKYWKSNLDAQGIVLLDEIDAHLHPRWKIQIVSKIREAFPNIQFFSTTHDPLCLRGLEPGEIVILKRDRLKKVKVLRDFSSVDGYEIDQILTSDFFGLHNTTSSKFNKWFEEYYRLLSRPVTSLTKLEEERFIEIKQLLNEYELLGKTPREQIIYKIIDEYLATRKGTHPLDLQKIDQETKNEILEMLKSYGV